MDDIVDLLKALLLLFVLVIIIIPVLFSISFH